MPVISSATCLPRLPTSKKSRGMFSREVSLGAPLPGEVGGLSHGLVAPSWSLVVRGMTVAANVIVSSRVW